MEKGYEGEDRWGRTETRREKINQTWSEEDGMRKKGAKEGKLSDDHSKNSLDPPGGPLREAPTHFLSLSVSRALSLTRSLSSSLLLLFHS